MSARENKLAREWAKTRGIKVGDRGRLPADIPVRYRSAQDHLNPQQFYHGTSAELGPGDLIEPGHPAAHNISSQKHVYFTASQGDARGYGRISAQEKVLASHDYQPPENWLDEARTHTHVYEVEPTGRYTWDRNAFDADDSYQTRHPLRVVREIGEKQ